MDRRENGSIEFKVERHIAALGDSGGAWNLELNLVSWNGRPAKLDIRPWEPSHARMGKGITLTREEAERLHAALGSYLGAP